MSLNDVFVASGLDEPEPAGSSFSFGGFLDDETALRTWTRISTLIRESLKEMKPNHEHYLSRAIELARQNVEVGDGGPFGAVIVKKGSIIAEASNQVVPDEDPSAHAEIAAIRMACKALKTHELSGCDIYASCEPCPMCLGAIYWARLDRVFFAADRYDATDAGFDDGFLYEELVKAPGTRKIPTRRIAVDEATAPFELWKRKTDRNHY